MIIYVVKRGDTVNAIARRFGVREDSIIYVNQLSYPYRLVVGQSLLLVFGENQFYTNSFEENNMEENRQAVNSFGANAFAANGFAYPFISVWVLRQTLPYLQELSVFSYGFTTEGELVFPQLPTEWMIREAYAYGVKPILTLTPFGPDGRFNNYLIHAVLSDETIRNTLIRNVSNMVEDSGYQGVNIDFEFILSEDRDLFSAFVRDMTFAIRELGYEVTVDLAPKTSAAQTGLLYEGKDYRALGEAADRALVMTYEWGYTYGPAMAVAPINKVREVLDYAVTEIPPQKLSMGIPNYGYDWALPYVRGESKAVTIGNVEAVQIAINNNSEILYDETARSPYFQYVSGGTTHEIWFEDARSIYEKYRLIREYGLYGFGCWQIMQLFRVMWIIGRAEPDEVEIVE